MGLQGGSCGGAGLLCDTELLHEASKHTQEEDAHIARHQTQLSLRGQAAREILDLQVETRGVERVDTQIARDYEGICKKVSTLYAHHRHHPTQHPTTTTCNMHTCLKIVDFPDSSCPRSRHLWMNRSFMQASSISCSTLAPPPLETRRVDAIIDAKVPGDEGAEDDDNDDADAVEKAP